MTQTIPTAQPDSLFGALHHARALRNDTLGHLETLAAQGDILQIRFGPVTVVFVNHPDYVREVLVTQNSKFQKPANVKNAVQGLIGYNLFSADGDTWRVLRKAMQPAFHNRRINAYAQLMVEMTEEVISSWQPDTLIDIPEAAMHLTLGITTKALFDVDLRDDKAGAAVLRFLELFNERSTGAPIPAWLPTPANREMRQAIAVGDDLLQPIIDERRQSGEDRGDLLSMLIMAQAQDDSGVLTDHQVRNEILNLFAAGYEVAAYTTAFTLYLISKHPHVEKQLLDEIDDVLRGRRVTLEDLGNLPYLEMVIKESMRLYPVTTMVGRQAVEGVTVDGYTIPAKATVLVAPWTLHRREDVYQQPEQFDPQRFSPENEAQIHKHAYIPFSTGPRICIGNAFAMLQLKTTLATILQNFRLQIPQDYVFEPMFRFNTRPKHGLPMRTVARREQTTPSQANR